MSKSTGSFFRRRLIIISVTPIVPILVYSVFCIMGLVHFELWSQVIYIWKLNLTLADTFVHPVGLRFLLVFPLLKLSEWLGISYNWLFSITVPVLIYLITLFITQSALILRWQESIERRALIFIGVSLFFIFLSLFMNGRLIFAFTGSSVLMWSLLNWDNNQDRHNLLAVMTAIFLCSVSRGTFLVTIVSFYFFLAVNIATANPSVCRRKVILIYTILLVLLTPFLKIQIQHLLIVFGGGISAVVKMLGHGYGAKLLQTNLSILVVGLVFISSLGYRYRHLILRYWILASLIFFSLAGGLFGISTALVTLPPLVVTIAVATLAIIAGVERQNSKSIVRQR